MKNPGIPEAVVKKTKDHAKAMHDRLTAEHGADKARVLHDVSQALFMLNKLRALAMKATPVAAMITEQLMGNIVSLAAGQLGDPVAMKETPDAESKRVVDLIFAEAELYATDMMELAKEAAETSPRVFTGRGQL